MQVIFNFRWILWVVIVGAAHKLQQTPAELATVKQQMLETCVDDWLQPVICCSRWPLFMEHSGSKSSKKRTDLHQHHHRLFLTAELFLMWRKRLLDIRVCERHEVDSCLGGETAKTESVAWPRLLGTLLFINLPWRWIQPQLILTLKDGFFILPQCSFQKPWSWNNHCRSGFSGVTSLLPYCWWWWSHSTLLFGVSTVSFFFCR